MMEFSPGGMDRARCNFFRRGVAPHTLADHFDDVGLVHRDCLLRLMRLVVSERDGRRGKLRITQFLDPLPLDRSSINRWSSSGWIRYVVALVPLDKITEGSVPRLSSRERVARLTFNKSAHSRGE